MLIIIAVSIISLAGWYVFTTNPIPSKDSSTNNPNKNNRERVYSYGELEFRLPPDFYVQDRLIGNLAILDIYTTAPEKPGLTPANFSISKKVTDFQSELKTLLAIYVTYEQEKVKIDGVEGIIIWGKSKPGFFGDAQIRNVIFSKNNIVYIFGSQIFDNPEIFNKILSTFKFTN